MDAVQPVLVSSADTSAPLTHPSGDEVRMRKPRLAHIRELDGIRGIAALAVFFHHLCYTSINPQEWGRGVRGLYDLSTFGYTGVDLFFVLSGFLITSLLIQDRSSPAYYRNFYWKRVLRILPLYILCLLAVFLFVPNSHGYVLLAAMFIVNFAQALHVPAVGPFWTLAIEEQFYLLWPTVVRRRSVAQLTRWSIGVGLSAVILRLVAASIGHYNYDLTFLHCDGLAIGAFIACRYSQRNVGGDSSSTAPTRWIAAAFVAGVVLFAMRFLPHSSKREFAFAMAACQTGISLLAGSVIAFVIVHTGSRYLALFRSRLFTFFGLISYAFYLVHTYVLMAYEHFSGPLPPGDLTAYFVRFVAVLAMSIGVSLLTYYLIERPALSLRKYVLTPSA
jgi:peptidoglycan/LPS O-acetylase OafA/YrhL